LLWDNLGLPDLMGMIKEFFSGCVSILEKIAHKLRRNTKRGSKKNIKKHYDISNDFYRLWLDETMTYSCAVFGKNMNLKQAQNNKYKKICERIGLKKGDHILEIGTGWGGFSIFAARHYDVNITTVTISREQYKLAKQRIIDAGLEDKINLKFQDYRDIKGKYDKIVSIEMMEALGYEYVPLFIKKCNTLLKERGKMCLQAITYPDKYFNYYLKSQDYIKKHIFPGGELLSIKQITKEAKKNNLNLKNIDEIGKDYAITLNKWRKNFIKKKKEIFKLGFDQKFYLKWIYYLIYCEVGFETGYIGNVQILLKKE